MNLFWQYSDSIRTWLPRLQSHRGYCQTGLPENTLQSIQKACDLKYEMIEFDVRLTKDLQVILFHDDFILVNKERKLIQNLNLNEVKELVFINTLADVLQWLQNHLNKEVKLNIELKTASLFNSSLERKVVGLIHQYRLQTQILISSFNPLALARIRTLDASLYRALLVTFEKSPQNKWFLRKMLFNVFCKPHALHLFYKDWSRYYATKGKIKVPVVLWTYDDSLQDLDFKAIHGIISDRITPEKFLEKVF